MSRLENIRIASPCSANWDDMAAVDGERVRFCGKCEKNVYNLSAMSRAEAEALVEERSGKLCLRFYQRADGTVLTTDCPVGVRRARFHARVWAKISGVAASLALMAGLARADVSVTDGKPPPAAPKNPRHFMGAAARRPPPDEKPTEAKKPEKKVIRLEVIGGPG